MAQPYLNSRVGRRLLLRFVLAALLPMGAVSLFAYYQVGSMLVDLNYRRLQQDSRSLGMSFIEGFNWRAHALKREAARMAMSGAQPSQRLDGFQDLSQVVSTATLTIAEARHLNNMGVLLRLSGESTATLVARIPGTRRLLQGHLDARTLWRDEAAPEHYCVVATNFHPVFCTPGLRAPSAEIWPGLLARQNLGVFDWGRWEGSREEAYLAAFWRANLRSAYAHPGFIVMVADSKQAVLKDLERFRRVFPALIIAALALAILLAINQIRRQMRPLEQLAEGTRRLAEGDFSATVQAAGDDEFSALAGAFNHMSGSLRYKFHMLEMLSELDQAILGVSEMDYLIHAVLSHIRRAVPCDGAGLLRFDASGQSVFLAAPAGAEDPPSAIDWAGIWEHPRPDVEQPCLGLDLDAPAGHCLRPLFDESLKQALAFPIRLSGRLTMILILAYEKTPVDLADILAAGRSVADRLEVAASNLAWEKKLYHQAHYDALTDLPNRALLRDRVEQGLIRADREQTSIAVMLLDLDNFKQINDSLGHTSGDALLVEYAKRLKAQVRQSDTVVRLGGDEFVILLPDLTRGGETAILDTLARKLNQHLAEPMLIADRQITAPASIGIAIYPGNAGGYEDLLKMADAAMYESKRRQRGGFSFYSAAMNDQAQARFELTQDLRVAVARDELALYYQPKVELATGRWVGAEALVRWLSPQRGVVPPGLFVPLLGELGLDDWLSDWVLETACAQMAEWDRMGLPAISVSVNMSPSIFQQEHLIPKVRELFVQHGLEPWRLELEILETTEINASEQVRSVLVGLRAMAVSIALDDFGTGYSSLVYLTQLPANILKLDRAFILDLVGNARQQAIVERIIALAKALDFLVVAEGVEDEAQRDLLTGMGCNLIQGYLISPPLPAESFVHHLREHAGG